MRPKGTPPSGRASSRILIFTALAVLPACGAILDLPEPSVSDDFNASDGSGSNDGLIQGDGAGNDGVAAGDGSANDSSVDPDGSKPVVDAGEVCGTAHCYGGQCVSNLCTQYSLTPANPHATEIVFDGTYVFFISGTGTIDRLDSSLGSVTITNDQLNLTSLTVGNGNVYFANAATGGANTDGRVSSCPIAGCGASDTNIHDFLSGSKHVIYGLAVTGSTIFYGDKEATGGTTMGGIHSCGLPTGPCGASADVSVANANDLKGSDLTLFWLAGIGGTTGLFSCTESSCGSTNTAGGNTSVVDFAVGGGYFFLTATGVWHQSSVSGAGSQWYGGSLANVAIVTDDTNLFWLDQGASSGSGTLNRCSIASGCTDLKVLAGNLTEPHDLALGSGQIYFTTDDGVYGIGI